VLADLVARAFRIQWLLRGVGQRIRWRDAFVINAFGEAGCALTPLRLGGEPSRLAGMVGAGVPAPAAVVAIAVEVLAAWPVILTVAAVMIWFFAPAWWASAWPALRSSVALVWPWALAVLLLTLLVGWIASRWARASGQPIRPRSRLAAYWRQMPRSPVLASAPCTLVNVLSRTALLPVLALTLPQHPPLGAMLLGSFGLLYSQLLLPTPAGLGAVDLGLLAGAAGDLGAGETGVLLAWRFYSVGFGALLGIGFALKIYGWAALRRLVSSRENLGPPSRPAAPPPS
jgi:uncharacterized membrane protein YbhN (UPF0104 family)